jgi:hypothetical protein
VHGVRWIRISTLHTPVNPSLLSSPFLTGGGDSRANEGKGASCHFFNSAGQFNTIVIVDCKPRSPGVSVSNSLSGGDWEMEMDEVFAMRDPAHMCGVWAHRCCDSSPSQHASKHAQRRGIRALQLRAR